jgi:tyrosine-protein kinase Etk/Wzc
MRQDLQDEDEATLLDYWRVLVKRRWLVLGLAVLPALFTGIYCFFLATKIYESKAAVLPPKETGGGTAAGLTAALAASGVAPLVGGVLPGGVTTRDTFVAILKSRTMGEEIIARFKLRDYYEAKYAEEAVKTLQGATDIVVSKEGVVFVRVEDKDPKLAADIANAYVTNLDRTFAKLGTTEGSRQRAFIADRLEGTEKSLRQAEDALRRFQEANKAIGLQEQARGTIEASAQLKGEMIAAEVALESLRTFSTEANPQVVQQKARIEEMKRQLDRLQYSGGSELPPDRANPGGKARQEYYLPPARMPAVAVEYARLMREVKIQETVFTLLTQQIEQAKIAEAGDKPTVQFLDRAVPAERKSKPKTVLTSAIVGVLSLFFGIFLAFFLEYVDRARALRASPAS